MSVSQSQTAVWCGVYIQLLSSHKVQKERPKRESSLNKYVSWCFKDLPVIAHIFLFYFLCLTWSKKMGFIIWRRTRRRIYKLLLLGDDRAGMQLDQPAAGLMLLSFHFVLLFMNRNRLHLSPQVLHIETLWWAARWPLNSPSVCKGALTFFSTGSFQNMMATVCLLCFFFFFSLFSLLHWKINLIIW